MPTTYSYQPLQTSLEAKQAAACSWSWENVHTVHKVTHIHMQELSHSARPSETVILKDMRGTWSARSFLGSAFVSHFNRAMNQALLRREESNVILIWSMLTLTLTTGHITTLLPFILCLFVLLTKGMDPHEQAAANLPVTHVTQVCCAAPHQGAFLPHPASIRL